MKLGNGLGASGAYFLKVFWVAASCNLRAFWGEQVAPFLRALGRKLQSCMFATNGGFAQVDKLRENV